MIYISRKEPDADSKVILVPMPRNDVTDSVVTMVAPSNTIDDVLSADSEFVDLASNFVKYYYYEPLWDDSDDIFKFFEECPIGNWAKNSPEHYLMNQLQLNRNGNRVWDCSAAEIVVIPISLGNYAGTRCGVQLQGESAWESVESKMDNAIIDRINRRIFGDPNSCWNIEPRTRPFHLLLVGDWKGRKFIRSMSGPVPTAAPTKSPSESPTAHSLISSLFNRFRSHFESEKTKNNNQSQTTKSTYYGAHKWFDHKLIFVDTWTDSWIKSKKQMVTLSNGFTSMASFRMTMLKQVMSGLPTLSKELEIDVSGSKLGPNELPEITIRSNFEEWKQRKFNLFLMGQADEREAYTLRRMALRQLPFEDNVLIQTGRETDKWRMTECRETPDGMGHEFYPCSMGAHARKYMNLLARSRFNLMFRGDEPCSSRFYDGLAFNVINIVISDGFDGCVIGRSLLTEQQRNMLYLTVREQDFRANATASIYNEINRFNDAHFERMLKEIDKWKPYLLWDSYRSETAEFVLLEAFKKVKR